MVESWITALHILTSENMNNYNNFDELAAANVNGNFQCEMTSNMSPSGIPKAAEEMHGTDYQFCAEKKGGKYIGFAYSPSNLTEQPFYLLDNAGKVAAFGSIRELEAFINANKRGQTWEREGWINVRYEGER